jgi:triphosphoribosyl-dephospho-CoA synthase
MNASTIAALFRRACAIEIAALKPGNVHVHAPGHGMTAADFRLSARVAAAPLCRAGAPLGARVLGAVAATRAAVGQNTNLGILLLAAPLAMAAARGRAPLRGTLAAVLAAADAADADAVFRAIVLAAPGGLGTAPAHDVRAPARAALPVAMAAAAGRDAIARQYVTGFADIFTIGVPAYARARAAGRDAAWAAVAAYLAFLAALPDSHVGRRHGAAAAASLRAAARPWPLRLAAAADPTALVPELLAWDAALKARGYNPGTSADLTVGAIFAYLLAGGLRAGGADGFVRPARARAAGRVFHGTGGRAARTGQGG